MPTEIQRAATRGQGTARTGECAEGNASRLEAEGADGAEFKGRREEGRFGQTVYVTTPGALPRSCLGRRQRRGW